MNDFPVVLADDHDLVRAGIRLLLAVLTGYRLWARRATAARR